MWLSEDLRTLRGAAVTSDPAVVGTIGYIVVVLGPIISNEDHVSRTSHPLDNGGLEPKDNRRRTHGSVLESA